MYINQFLKPELSDNKLRSSTLLLDYHIEIRKHCIRTDESGLYYYHHSSGYESNSLYKICNKKTDFKLINIRLNSHISSDILARRANYSRQNIHENLPIMEDTHNF